MPTGKNGVVIDDTFGRATVKPVRASRFCAPAAKGRSAPNASKIYLGCYPVVSQIAGANLILATGFGLMRAALGRRDEVCVAAA
jgi:hypothetical protein